MKILTKNWLVYKIHDDYLHQKVKAYVKGKLLDIGCGEKPYAEMVKPYVTEHIGVDHQGTLHDKSNIDRFGTAYEIPAEDGEFDSAIYTAVQEKVITSRKESHLLEKQDRILIKTSNAPKIHKSCSLQPCVWFAD